MALVDKPFGPKTCIEGILIYFEFQSIVHDPGDVIKQSSIFDGPSNKIYF